MKRLVCLIGSVWALAGTSVHAQTVYRCGPDGSSYSAVPCKDGRPVDVDDARTDAQRQQAQRAVRGDAAAAEALERQRVARDAQAVRAANVGPAKRAAPPIAVKHPKHAKPKHRASLKNADGTDDFRAIAPRPAKSAVAKPAHAAASRAGSAVAAPGTGR